MVDHVLQHASLVPYHGRETHDHHDLCHREARDEVGRMNPVEVEADRRNPAEDGHTNHENGQNPLDDLEDLTGQSPCPFASRDHGPCRGLVACGQNLDLVGQNRDPLEDLCRNLDHAVVVGQSLDHGVLCLRHGHGGQSRGLVVVGRTPGLSEDRGPCRGSEDRGPCRGLADRSLVGFGQSLGHVGQSHHDVAGRPVSSRLYRRHLRHHAKLIHLPAVSRHETADLDAIQDHGRDANHGHPFHPADYRLSVCPYRLAEKVSHQAHAIANLARLLAEDVVRHPFHVACRLPRCWNKL